MENYIILVNRLRFNANQIYSFMALSGVFLILKSCHLHHF